MGFFEKVKEKTIADVVDTAKEKVNEAVKSTTEEKVKGILSLLPLAATAILIFSEGKSSGTSDIPAKTIINNYYYGERKVKGNVSNDH